MFYSLDYQNMKLTRQRYHKESTSDVEQKVSSNNENDSKETKGRYKYCYRVGHTDISYKYKQSKRPPSMPQQTKHAT